MNPLELDQLVREIGSEVFRRLGEPPKAAAGMACACGTTAEPRPAANGHAVPRGVGVPGAGLGGLISQAILKPDATEQEIRSLCREARGAHLAAVSVQPSRVALAVRELSGSGMTVSAVIGYPHGATLTPVKLVEAEQVMKLGATELELTVHPGALQSGDLDSVYTEIRSLAHLAHDAGAVLKVLAEMALLSEEQKVNACVLAKLGGADFVKTATDLAGLSAATQDVALAYRIVGGDLGIEAAGQIDSYARLEEMMAAGATRISTAASAQILGQAPRA